MTVFKPKGLPGIRKNFEKYVFIRTVFCKNGVLWVGIVGLCLVIGGDKNQILEAIVKYNVF
jgi:hypothetical protein